MSEKERIDKWLWAARFFKTRSLANEAVSGGKVHVDGARVKPSKQLQVGQTLEISKGPYEFVVTVDELDERRRSAPGAREMYTESEASQQRREALEEKLKAERAAMNGIRYAGKPNKRDRRLIHRIQGKD